MNEDIEAAREDYGRFVHEHGMNQIAVRQIVENGNDQTPMPTGFDALERRPSEIEGQGMFATRDVPAGTVLAPARLDQLRTPAGRFTNHSQNPNARFELLPNGDLQLVAVRALRPGEEVTVNYRENGRINGWDREEVRGAIRQVSDAMLRQRARSFFD